jgi:hypothetical protein
MHCRREHVSRHRDHRGVGHRDHVPRNRLLQQRRYRAAEFTAQGKSENGSTVAVLTEHGDRSALNQMHLLRPRTSMRECHAGSNISPITHGRKECELIAKWLFARHPSPAATGSGDRCRQSGLRPRHAGRAVPIVARRPRRCPGRRCSRCGSCPIAASAAPNWRAITGARLTSRRPGLGVRIERSGPRPNRVCCSISFHSVSLRRASRTTDHGPHGQRSTVRSVDAEQLPVDAQAGKTPGGLASLLPGCSAPGCGHLAASVDSMAA